MRRNRPSPTPIVEATLLLALASAAGWTCPGPEGSFTGEFIEELPVPSGFYTNVLTLGPGPFGAPPPPETSYERLQHQSWLALHRTLDRLWNGTPEQRLEAALEASDGFFALYLEPDAGDERVEDVIASLTDFLDVESDEWVLDRLTAGLADMGAESLAPLFREALRHRSPNVRRRAVEYFSDVEDPLAVPRLERLMESESRAWVRIDLIEALSWNEVERLEETCIPLMRANDVELAVAAVECTGDGESPGALSALVERARNGPPPVRAAALFELCFWPHSRDAMEAVIEGTRHTDSVVQWNAVQALEDFPYEAARRRLEEMAKSPTVHACSRAIAAETLAEPEVSGELIQARRDACGDIDDWEWEGHVVPPGGTASIRCWRGPHLAGEPADHPRIPAGTSVQIYDRFEAEEGMWIEMFDRDCWIPLAVVEEGTTDAEPADDHPLEEFDVRADLLESALAGYLLDGGELTVIDPHTEVVGIALALDPNDSDRVAGLFDVIEPGDSPLHNALRSTVRTWIDTGALESDLLDRAWFVVGEEP